jgi:hypothetical protein
MLALLTSLLALSVSAQNRDDDDGDADLPPIARGKIDKQTYLRLRQEHIDKLRGLDPANRGRQSESRARAVRQLEQQQLRQQQQTGSTTSTAPAETTATSMEMAAATAVPGVWTPIGPAPISNGQTFSVVNSVSGRVTCIAVSPANGNVVYVGTAQGGVYRSLDGGASWTQIMDNALSLAIGAIAIDPSDPSRVFVGTGEVNFGERNYFGVGVYRIDSAETVPVLTLLNKDAAGNDVFSGRGISKILVAPGTGGNVIFVSTASSYAGVSSDVAYSVTQTPPSPLRGIYRSSDAAAAAPTFTKLPTSATNNLGITDMIFNPADASFNTIIYAVLNNGSVTDGGIYRMTNAQGASSYTKLLTVGTSTTTSRVNLASNSTGSLLLATAEESSGTLRKSTDGGTTWTTLAAAAGFCGGQCWYDAPVAIDANNNIYIGGNADGASSAILKKSTDGGATFVKVQNGLHADSHAIAFDTTTPSTVYTGNDGGIFKSTTGGTGNWQSLNGSTTGGSINSMQYMSVAVHPTDPYFTIGGTQDNGTHRIKTDGTWTRTDYGDGGFALIDQSATGTTSVRQYHTYYNQVGSLMGIATTTSSTAFENWAFYGCGGTPSGINCRDSAVLFYAPIALGPGSPNTIYYGSDRLYRSINGGATMKLASQRGFVSGVPISAIGISPQNDNVRIVGLQNGKVYKTTTGSLTLTDATPNANVKYVARAVVDPNNQNTAYITTSGFYGSDNGQHVYKTTNLSATTPTWTVAGVGIPDVPVNSFVINKASGFLYAGTDIGVYTSTDGGATWTAFSNGLPRVAVFDMAITSTGVLRIATHGRGMWEIQL